MTKEIKSTKRIINRFIREAIVFAIDELGQDIRSDSDPDNNRKRAEAIHTLTEAYKNVR